ncbi:MAG: hypothetical protein M3Y59_13625 [Myxococcota bacterium]|nr:hypothetical protein [Myxococcota bacterium]
MDFRKQLRHLTDWDKDDVLDLVGLETRRTASDALVPTLAAFGVGVLVGVGVGLMIARKPGAELRSELGARIGAGTDNLGLKPAGTSSQPKQSV